MSESVSQSVSQSGRPMLPMATTITQQQESGGRALPQYIHPAGTAHDPSSFNGYLKLKENVSSTLFLDKDPSSKSLNGSGCVVDDSYFTRCGGGFCCGGMRSAHCAFSEAALFLTCTEAIIQGTTEAGEKRIRFKACVLLVPRLPASSVLCALLILGI